VGVVLFNREGKAWLGRRTGAQSPYNWQFPQGGVDSGEELLDAARRELQEETGVSSISLLGRTEDWFAYDFPEGWTGSKALRGWRGQKQVWFAFRFEGEDAEVDLNAHQQPEFDAWRWVRLEETADLIVPFKRAVYDQVIAAFGRFAVPSDRPSRRQSVAWLGKLFREE
jgi:putative (di)nucleoside polyphosphate hydrolase